jgi:hypothetical protein
MYGHIISSLTLALLPPGVHSPAAPVLLCPPQISIERPTDTTAGDLRSAFLLVTTRHGCHPGPLTLSGTAVGLVDGARRSMSLELVATATPGVYAVRRQWSTEGVWVLRFVLDESGGHVTALVGINRSGDVTTVRVPGRSGVIRDYSDEDVEALLRSLVA